MPALDGVATVDRVAGVVEVGDEVQVEPDDVDQPLDEASADLRQRLLPLIVG